MVKNNCKNVLIIDDDPSIVDFIKLELSREGIQFLSETNIDKIEVILNNHNIDLVFLDIILGVNETSELIVKLLQKKSFNDIPIIIMSSHITQKFSDKIKKKWDNVKNTLKKPFEKGDIISAILKVQKNDRKEIRYAVAAKNDQFLKEMELYPSKSYKSSVHIDHRDSNGLTSLMKVCAKGNYDLTKKLLDNNADATLTAKNGKTSFHFACMAGSLDIIKLLLEKNLSIKTKDELNREPLFYAIKYNHQELVKLLIKNGANINVRIQKGQTYLHYLVIKKNIKMFKYLISKNIDQTVKDHNGNTARSLANTKELFDFITVLDNSTIKAS